MELFEVDSFKEWMLLQLIVIVCSARSPRTKPLKLIDLHKPIDKIYRFNRKILREHKLSFRDHLENLEILLRSEWDVSSEALEEDATKGPQVCEWTT